MVVATYNCGWSGVAKIGYQSWSTPNGTVTIGTSIVDALAPTKTYGHETGHTFGVYHAAYLDCGSSVMSGSCTRDEYGDPFDIMGVYTYTENDILGQLNAYHKAKIGWLSGSSIPTVTTTNTYTLLPYESTATGIKALKIPSGSNTYYVEYRQPIGTDGNFRNTNIYSGALVHRYLQASGNGGGSDTDLLDMTPSGSAYYPVITPGSSYQDSSTGMTISVLSASSTGMSVKVTIPGTTQAPPTPTPTPIPGDLVVDSFQLLDSNGNVKTTFAPGEAIYPKLTPRNASLGVATAANKVTSEQFYSNAPTTVSQGTVSDVNVRLLNGQFQPGDTNTYYCVPAPGNKCSNYDQSQYWTKPAGTYTARVFLNYDHNALESNYSNNQATVSYTVVAPVTPTNTPTPTTIPTLTLTPTPQPTATTAPTATPAPGTAHISLSLLLQGIGNGGDNVNPSSTGNTNPLHPQRSVTLFIKDASNTIIAQPTGTVTYDLRSGGFKGTVDATIIAGSYLITVQSPQYLNRTVSGIISLSPNTTTTLPVTTLVAGDVNNDNALNILDYNLILDCYSDLAPARNCSDPAKKTATDITDDGSVNQIDYNLFLRNLGSQSGQ